MRVVGQLGRTQHRGILLGRQRRQRTGQGTSGNNVDPRGDDGRHVVVGPLTAVGHAEAGRLTTLTA